MSLPEPLALVVRRRWWKETGSLGKNLVFRRHLHVFSIGKTRNEVAHMRQHYSFAWVNAMPKPDIEELTAIGHMTNFAMWPNGWDTFIHALVVLGNYNRDPIYWILLAEPSASAATKYLVIMKRQISNEMFSAGAPFNGDLYNERIMHALEPLLVYPSLRRVENEVDRTSEVGQDPL